MWDAVWRHPRLESLLRILVGTPLGSTIGFERDLHGRQAGLRTHAIVALGAATFMVVSPRGRPPGGAGRRPRGVAGVRELELENL